MSRKNCYEDDYRVFKIEDGETHWTVEMLPEEALESHAVGSLDYPSVEAYQNEMGPVTCEVVPWNKEITRIEDDGTKTVKTARDWAVTERGVFCSTNY